MKPLITSLLLLLASSVFAQTDALNLEKYWKFRNEFVEKFVKVGDQPQPTGVSKRSPIEYIPVFLAQNDRLNENISTFPYSLTH